MMTGLNTPRSKETRAVSVERDEGKWLVLEPHFQSGRGMLPKMLCVWSLWRRVRRPRKSTGAQLSQRIGLRPRKRLWLVGELSSGVDEEWLVIWICLRTSHILRSPRMYAYFKTFMARFFNNSDAGETINTMLTQRLKVDVDSGDQ
jgi:hypothetical protein